jgi:hypothetical protein
MGTLTIFVDMPPLVSLCHTGKLPEPRCLGRGVFQALLDLNPIVRPNQITHDDSVAQRCIEGLVAATLTIEDVFADHLPFPLKKHRLPEDLIRMTKTVQDKPGICQLPSTGVSNCMAKGAKGVAYSWVIPSLSLTLVNQKLATLPLNTEDGLHIPLYA